jgi:hypothetical protein
VHGGGGTHPGETRRRAEGSGGTTEVIRGGNAATGTSGHGGRGGVTLVDLCRVTGRPQRDPPGRGEIRRDGHGSFHVETCHVWRGVAGESQCAARHIAARGKR